MQPWTEWFGEEHRRARDATGMGRGRFVVTHSYLLIWYDDLMAPIWDHVNTLLEMSTCGMGRKLRNLQLQHAATPPTCWPRSAQAYVAGLAPTAEVEEPGNVQKIRIRHIFALLNWIISNHCMWTFWIAGTGIIWFLSSSAENGGLAWTRS